jgi:hypothetical protein
MNLQKTKTLIEERAKEIVALNTIISLRANKGYENETQFAIDSTLSEQLKSEVDFLQKLVKSLI